MQVKSVSEFLQQIEEKTKHWIEDEYLWFRGVSNKNYSLVPSAYRDNNELVSCGDVYNNEIEYNIISKFKRESLPYLDYQYKSDWELYFLIQHYGISTRLLDWTENSLFALYFAVRNYKNSQVNPVVWIMQPGWLNWLSTHEETSDIIDCTDKAYYNIIDKYKPAENPSLKNPSEQEDVLPPLAVIPAYSNKLIHAQRGVFTIHKDGGYDMKEWYEKLHYRLTNVEIDSRYVHEIYRQLRIHGIRESVLFPDLYGLAKDINSHFGLSPIKSYIKNE